MIRLENIEVTYGLGTDTEIRALRIPCLEVDSGCWCNVIGPNGSGKTTLLKVLSGEIESFSGSIFINNHDVTKWKARHLSISVQLLEQSPDRNTIPSMSIMENLYLYSHKGRFPSFSLHNKGTVEKVKQLLNRFDMELDARLSSQVALLSGGQKQAVALAAVLLRSPKVLLLDEFLASMDPNASPKLLSVVRETAAEQGITVLMVSHDLKHVETIGDRLIILSNGQIADDLVTTDRVLQRSEIISRYSAILERRGIL
jgi:putative ABC transport system ATP-binding protein